jgi:hypothetical protein
MPYLAAASSAILAVLGGTMSQYQPPLDYASASLPAPNPRPTSVTVIAILGIIFGALGILGGLCTLPQYLGMDLTPGGNPMIGAVRNDPILIGMTLGGMVLGMLLGGIELFGSVGLLQLKPLGRTLMIVYAIAMIAMAVISLPINILLVNSRMLAMAASLPATPGMNPAAMTKLIQYSMYGGECWSVVFLIWPALVLYFLNQPAVKLAFGQAPK